MNGNKIKIKAITQISVLAALASSLGLIDKVISINLFPMIPGIKIGISNVIILIGIIKYNLKEASIITLLKIIIVSFLFGGLTSLLIGGTSSIVSFLIMYYIYKKHNNKLSIVSISVIGGFIHINMQLLLISLIYNIGKEVYIYGFILILISLVTSIIIGMIVKKISNSYIIMHIN